MPNFLSSLSAGQSGVLKNNAGNFSAGTKILVISNGPNGTYHCKEHGGQQTGDLDPDTTELEEG